MFNTSRLFFPRTQVSSTNKEDRIDITEIALAESRIQHQSIP